MSKWSATSEFRLETCHPKLRELFNAVLPIMDCSILCGHRGQGAQEQAFISGASRVQWPNSKHNKTPSLAVDVAPYPVDWSNISRFIHFAGIVKGVAHCLGIKIKWGGDWKTFKDYPHYELAEE